MQLHKFHQYIPKRAERLSERFGQAAYNLLDEVRPDLAEWRTSIRST